MKVEKARTSGEMAADKIEKEKALAADLR